MKLLVTLAFVVIFAVAVNAQQEDGFCPPNEPQDPDCQPGPIYDYTINNGFCDPWEFGTGAPDCNEGVPHPSTVNDGNCDPWEVGTGVADCEEAPSSNEPPSIEVGIPRGVTLLEGEPFGRIGIWVRAADVDGEVRSIRIVGSQNVRFTEPAECAGTVICTIPLMSDTVLVSAFATIHGEAFDQYTFYVQVTDDDDAITAANPVSGQLKPFVSPPPPLTPPTITLFDVPQFPFAGEQFTIRAQARDSNGMSRLELRQGSTIVATHPCNGQQTCFAAFNQIAPAEPNVDFSYELIAFDMQGAHASQQRSGTTVPRPPPEFPPEIISFTGVPSSAQPGQQFTIEVTATDDFTGTIIALLLNGSTIDSTQCTTNECTLTTTVTAPSTFNTPYKFVAIATDVDGLQDTEERAGVTVMQDVDDKPVITAFNVPATADPGDVLSIPVAAVDDVRLVSLELYFEGEVIDSTDCSDSTCEDVFDFTAPATFDTEYVLTLVATDSDGNADVESRSGRTRKDVVDQNEAPKIDQFDFPTKVKPSEEFTIIVTASDDDEVRSIDVQFDGRDEFTCSENPCTVHSTVTAPSGFDAAYTYTAIVTDNKGLQTTQQKSGRTMKEGEAPQHDPSIDSFTVPKTADANTTITIKVDASDKDGDLERIELHHENKVIATQGCSGSSCTLDSSFKLPNLFDTVFEFIAKVFDSKGNDNHDHAATKTNPKPQPPIIPPVLPPQDEEEPEGKVSLRNMLSSSVIPESSCVAAGEDLYVFVSLSNKGDDALRDVKFKLTIPELGIYSSEGPFRLREAEKESRVMPLYIESGTQPGIYYLQFSATADNDKVVKYREIEINPRCKY